MYKADWTTSASRYDRDTREWKQASGTVRVTIDLDALCKTAAEKALSNSSGRARFLKGKIIAKVVRYGS